MAAFFRRNRNLEQAPESTPESSEGFSKDEEKWFAEFEGKNPYAKPEIKAKLAASDSADAEYRIRMKAPEPKKMKEPNRLAKFLGLGVLRNWEKEAAWLEQQDEMNKERAERIAAKHTVEQSLDDARAETRETRATVAEARGKAAEGSPAAARLDALTGAAEENAGSLESAGRNARAQMIESLKPVDPRTVSVDRLQALDDEETTDDDAIAYGEDGHMPFETTRPEETADAEREEDGEQMEDAGVIDAKDDPTKAGTETERDTEEQKTINAKELLDQIDTGGELVDVVHQLALLEALNTSKTSGRHNVEQLIGELKGELEGEGYEFDETGAIKLGNDKALYKNSADEGRVKLLQGLYELQELESSLHKQNDAVGYGEGGKFPFEPSKPEEENPKEIALRNIKAKLLAMFNDKDNDGVYSEVLADDILKEDFVSRDPELSLQAMSDLIRGLKEGLSRRGIRVSEEGTILLDKGSAPEQNLKYEKHKKTIDWINAFIVAEKKLGALKLKKTKKTLPHEAQKPESTLAGKDKPRKTKEADIRALGEEIQKLDIKEVARQQKQGLRPVRQSGPRRKAGTGRDNIKKAA